MTRYSKTMNEILAGIRGVSQINEAPEDNEPASPDEGGMAMDQLKFIEYAAKEIMQHIQGGGDFPEWMQNKLSGTHEKMKGLHANIDHNTMGEEVELDEKASVKSLAKEFEKRITKNNALASDRVQEKERHAILNLGVKSGVDTKALDKAIIDVMNRLDEEVELEESKSSTGYELYHKDFSTAMKHAYDFAKKKLGVDVDPKEIDDKVASGPRKPSKGKTNSYRLLGKDGKKAIQVQVYGMDNGKYELNMYKESVDLGEELTEGKLSSVAKDLTKYAMKNGGIDKNDFMKAAAMMKRGKDKELGKFTMDLDTEPRDRIIDMVKNAVGKDAAEKMFNVTIREEEEKPSEPQKPDSAKEVDQMRDDKKKTRVAQLQLQIAKAQETINKLNSQEK